MIMRLIFCMEMCCVLLLYTFVALVNREICHISYFSKSLISCFSDVVLNWFLDPLWFVDRNALISQGSISLELPLDPLL